MNDSRLADTQCHISLVRNPLCSCIAELRQRELRHEQVETDVADVVGRVREHDDTLLALLVETNKRAVAAGPSGVPVDSAPVPLANEPAQAATPGYRDL